MRTESAEAAFQRVCDDLVEAILEGDLDRDGVEAAKLEACREHGADRVPKNSELLGHGPDDEREALEAVLRRKPVRTASGVSPVAIMTSPHRCPHGKCLYCPGGPASEFSSAQSYTGHEPAAARGEQNGYDPYGQVTLRLHQLRKIGHPVDKVELILMGGTMTARSHDYQEWFVRRALEAMNDFDPDAEPAPAEDGSFAPAPGEREFRYLEDVVATNETGRVRNVATTFETKPDWCDPEQIDRMLALGGTKVEVGVQTTFERVNREMHRGHGVDASVDANRRLRDAAFKVGFHMMPGQPGMSREMSGEDLRRIFADPRWRPDYLKIYPTLVVGGTRVYDMNRRGDFEPLSSEEAADLVAEVKAELPRYVRLQRVQRDIPADLIDAGVRKSNLRQLARRRMDDSGLSCECIRCREVGMNDAEPTNLELDTLTYEAAGGTEHFISIEDFERDLLVGFARLRFPSYNDPTRGGDAGRSLDAGASTDVDSSLDAGTSTDAATPVRRELADAALVRELHVYGSEVALGDAAGESGHQHRGHGRRLMAAAEELAANAGYSKLAVIAGIGAREYYREKLGYHQDGPYVSTFL